MTCGHSPSMPACGTTNREIPVDQLLSLWRIQGKGPFEPAAQCSPALPASQKGADVPVQLGEMARSPKSTGGSWRNDESRRRCGSGEKRQNRDVGALESQPASQKV